MKTSYALLIVILLSQIIISCKKSSNTPVSPIGKWQETQLTLSVDSAGIIAHDTTYLHPFSASDYVQFKSDGTCDESTDHYYYINAYGYPTTPQAIPAVIATLEYSAVGPKYVLTQNLSNPGGFVVNDTASFITPTKMLIRSVFHTMTPGYVSISNAYYEKEN